MNYLTIFTLFFATFFIRELSARGLSRLEGVKPRIPSDPTNQASKEGKEKGDYGTIVAISQEIENTIENDTENGEKDTEKDEKDGTESTETDGTEHEDGEDTEHVDGEDTEQVDEPASDHDNEDIDQINDEKTDDGTCLDGWMNFQDKLCFYGTQEKKGFFHGVEECGKLRANFTSIHSMDEFRFITSHWDLRRFWIGIVYGEERFQDGTRVDQEVYDEFKKFVPWAWPEVPKGFICRALPGHARDEEFADNAAAASTEQSEGQAQPVSNEEEEDDIQNHGKEQDEVDDEEAGQVQDVQQEDHSSEEKDGENIGTIRSVDDSEDAEPKAEEIGNNIAKDVPSSNTKDHSGESDNEIGEVDHFGEKDAQVKDGEVPMKSNEVKVDN